MHSYRLDGQHDDRPDDETAPALTTREGLELRIAQLRAKQQRMPAHWEKRREEIADELEVLVLRWLATDA